MQSILSGTKTIYTKKFDKFTEYIGNAKLFNSRDVKILLKLVKFINIINAKFA